MSMLSPRLQLKVAQKQILTPGLVQMVTVLQLNRMELKEMINQEIVNNPVLEESIDGAEEVSAEELQGLLEGERMADPADQLVLDAAMLDAGAPEAGGLTPELIGESGTALEGPADQSPDLPVAEHAADPFDEIDYGSFFDDYLDPGYKSPASEVVDKPSFETFLSAPVTLGDHLHSQLSVLIMTDAVRDAAANIIGNLDENGYLMASIEEIAETGGHSIGEV